jgi:adenylate cyclase
VTGGRVERRLAAVLAADVAGYSRLMGADEVGTLEALKAHRREVVDPAIAANRGRIVKTTGDGMLVEFASAVDAVTCAVAVQEQMAARGGQISFRIGINVGDIISDGDDIFGDGVNIAARIENECAPGGVCLSDDAFRQVRGKTAFAFDDLGEQALKNIERPVRIYAARSSTAATAVHPAADSLASADTAKPLPLPDKPSIAVLPFQNMSGDPEQEYFCDGMAEDIITALSRFKSLFVIARNSSFSYKGKSPDIRQVGRELGVRYVLEGSVRKSGNRVRINGQLIEASNGHHLWADRFDGPLDDVFELQDRIVEQVVGAIGQKMTEAEIERTKLKRPDNLDGYDHLLRAQALMRSGLTNLDNLAAALVHLGKAIDLQPDYALAYALSARCYALRNISAATIDFEHEKQKGLEFARRALALDKDDPEVLCCAGHALCLDSLEDGVRLMERGTNLNPNLAYGWNLLGATSSNLGDHQKGLDCYMRALRLAPIGPDRCGIMSNISRTLLFMDKRQEAYDWAERAYQEDSNHLLASYALAASAALLENLPRANLAFQRIAHVYPAMRERNRRVIHRAEDFEKWCSAMRLAGAPE